MSDSLTFEGTAKRALAEEQAYSSRRNLLGQRLPPTGDIEARDASRSS